MIGNRQVFIISFFSIENKFYRYIELFNPSATKIPDDVYYESVGGKGRAPVFHQDPPAPPPEERPYQSEYAKYSGHEQYLPVPDEKYQPTGYPGSSSGHEAYGNGQQTMGYGASSSQPYQQQQQQSYDPYAQSYYSSYSNSNSKGDYNW
jgi:hypothetical protein